MALVEVDRKSDLLLATVQAPAVSGQLRVALYNPMTGEFDATVPPTVRLGELIGVRAFGLNNGSAPQLMRVDGVLRKPDGTTPAITGTVATVPIGAEAAWDFMFIADIAGGWSVTLVLMADFA